MTISLLTEALEALPSPPREVGRVVRVVLRPSRGTRQQVESALLTPDKGLEGDRWGKRSHKSRSRQLSAIRADVLDVLAGTADPVLAGDNLHLLFDLSCSHLPVGSQLQVGEAVVEVSPEKHTPCHQFSDRFGQEAHDITLAPQFSDLRLRGVMLSVIVGGRVAEGDPVCVVSNSP